MQLTGNWVSAALFHSYVGVLTRVDTTLNLYFSPIKITVISLLLLKYLFMEQFVSMVYSNAEIQQ